jgi:hypothetical protein
LNPHRLSVALFGDFRLVALALRQQSCVRRIENRSKTSCRQVHDSFTGADFRSGKQNHAANTVMYLQGIFRSMGVNPPVKTDAGSTPAALAPPSFLSRLSLRAYL